MKTCFIRGSVVRYVRIPADAVDTRLLEDATRRGSRSCYQQFPKFAGRNQCRRGPQPNKTVKLHLFDNSSALVFVRAPDAGNILKGMTIISQFTEL